MAMRPEWWRPGMLARAERAIRVTRVELFLKNYPADTPVDITDPATIGALVDAVRTMYSEPTAHLRSGSGGWYVERDTGLEHEWLNQDGTWGAGARNIW